MVFFFKQKTAYEMRISDWSSDVCSSDLMVIGLSDFLVHWWWALAAGLAAIALLGARALQDETLRLRFDTWLLRLPLFGRLLRDLHAARMARTLSTMVASRLPLLEGLKLTTQTVHNRALRAASEIGRAHV